MQHVEHVHLKHVLETVSVLEAVVRRSFGPDGGQVLFTRSTGEVMLSRSGTRILTALQLEHPMARMVVECVWKHSAVTGDGSKTFILLLASLLREIQTAACKEANASRTYTSRTAAEAATARRLAEGLLSFTLEELGGLITEGVVPYGVTISWDVGTVDKRISDQTTTDTPRTVLRLLSAFFYTRLGRAHRDLISRLTCELLSYWCSHNNNDALLSSLRFIDDRFPALHTSVSGFPASCSRLIEGLVIHRDFPTPYPQRDVRPLKAVVVGGPLQPCELAGGAVLELGGGGLGEIKMETGEKRSSVLTYRVWTERTLGCVVATLQRLGVTLVLSAVSQSEAFVALARRVGMCVVECVGEDELSLFCYLSGAETVSDHRLIGQGHVATLAFCQPILLGAHRYVHVGFPESEGGVKAKPHSLVICGPGEGQTDQCTCAVRDAFRMLLTALEPMQRSGSKAVESTSPTEIHHTDKTTAHKVAVVSSSGKCAPGLGCAVPVGGTFEFLLHGALLQFGSRSDPHSQYHTETGVLHMCRLLGGALLCVPRHVHSHSQRHFLLAQTQILNCTRRDFHTLGHVHKHGCRISPVPSYSKSDGPIEAGEMTCSGISVSDSDLESVSCKYQLILAVVQCVRSLLRVDAMLHTRAPLHGKPCRHSHTYQEDSEEEDRIVITSGQE